MPKYAQIRFKMNDGRYGDGTLKDVETVERDPERVRNWVNVTRNVIDEIF